MMKQYNSARFIVFHLLLVSHLILIGQPLNDVSEITKQTKPVSFEVLNFDEDQYQDVVSLSDTSWLINESKNGSFGVTKSHHWIRFSLVRHADDSSNYLLEVAFPFIYQIEFYAAGSSNSYLAGTSIGNQHKYKRGYIFPLEFETDTLVVHLKLTHPNSPLRSPIYVVQANLFDERHQEQAFFVNTWRGFVLFGLIISFIFFLITQERQFLYYFILNFGIYLFLSTEIGDIYFLLKPDQANLALNIRHLSNIIIIEFFLRLINSLSPVKNLNHRLWKFLVITWRVGGLLALINIFPFIKFGSFAYIFPYYFLVVTLITQISSIYLLVLGTIKKIRQAKVLLAIYTLYIISVVLNTVFPSLGLTGTGKYSSNLFIFSGMVEMLTFLILMAIETNKVYNQRQQLLIDQKNAQRKILDAFIEGQERERNQIGRDLHDMVGANMSIIKQKIPKQNEALRNLISTTIESVRVMSRGLVTPNLKGGEFIDEVTELCAVASNENIKIYPNFQGWNEALSEDKTNHLFRIMQELVQNALKHSKANKVRIQIIQNKQSVIVHYEDDGIGFDSNISRSKGTGLRGLQTRVNLLSGSINFITGLNADGTTITIEIPFPVMI